MEQNVLKKIKETASYILSLKGFTPTVAIVGGSGLSDIEKIFTVLKKIQYSKIPHFSKVTVQGHKGELLLCSYQNTNILIFNGRFHYYEGFSAKEVIYPIRVMKFLGIQTLLITAAVGAINKKYSVGDIVLIKDHLNFTGYNPLIGKHLANFDERFPSMGKVYDFKLRKRVLTIAIKHKIKVQEGIYCGVAGPSYETPAEIKAFKKLGADIIGMSVVYEAIVASQMKMNVLGITHVSNIAQNSNSKVLNHKQVLKNGQEATNKISKLIKEVVNFINSKRIAT